MQNGPQGKFFRILVSKEPMCSENYGNEPRSGVLNCVFCGQHVNNPLNLLFICCSEKQFKEIRNAACSCRATVACMHEPRILRPTPTSTTHCSTFHSVRCRRSILEAAANQAGWAAAAGAPTMHMQVRQLACRRRRLSLSAVACAINWAVVFNISR